MIEKHILDTVREYSLFPENVVVTVALSGGADSVALLYALHNLEGRLNITLKAAHLNHLIRGEEAFRDEEFVKKLCSSLNVPLHSAEIDVPKFAKEQGLSLETAARQVRYDFLNKINEGVIATAHTASDNLETVILNLTRGSGAYGLCGIPIKRDSIVRPLISCTREMIEDYCKKHSLNYVTDSTNLSDDYTRNKIRHLIVPVLKELNPRVENAVLRSSRSVVGLTDIAKQQSKSYIDRYFADNKLSLAKFSNLNSEVGKRVIIDFVALCDNEISLEACHIDSIYNVCINGGKTSLPRDKFCQRKDGYLNIGFAKATPKKIEFTVKIREEKINLREKSAKINNLLLYNALDCDKIIGKSVLRTRQSGDKIRLFGRSYSKSLTKLYNECKIPLELRKNLPVIADDSGVIWIHGIGVADRCAVSGGTERILKISVEKAEV